MLGLIKIRLKWYKILMEQVKYSQIQNWKQELAKEFEIIRFVQINLKWYKLLVDQVIYNQKQNCRIFEGS